MASRRLRIIIPDSKRCRNSVTPFLFLFPAFCVEQEVTVADFDASPTTRNAIGRGVIYSEETVVIRYFERVDAKATTLPPEVQSVFPNGLPPMTKPVGRQIRLKRASLSLLLRLVWEMKADDLAVHLGWSKSTVEREIRKFHLPRPEATYWLLKPAQRQIPAHVKSLFKLDETELKVELARLSSSPS